MSLTTLADFRSHTIPIAGPVSKRITKRPPTPFQKARMPSLGHFFTVDEQGAGHHRRLEMPNNWVTSEIGSDLVGIVDLGPMMKDNPDRGSAIFARIMTHGFLQWRETVTDPLEPSGTREVKLEKPRKWQFLTVSKSQLRSNGKFFVAAVDDAGIRRLREVAMGGHIQELEAETRPSKWFGKLHLAFAFMLDAGEIDFEVVPDLIDGAGRVRTDGAALIGWKSAELVRQALGIKRATAFQARLPGLKFVAQVSQDFPFGLKVCKSGHKYGPEKGTGHISILNWGKPGPANLNYQVIQMSDLGFGPLKALVGDVWRKYIGGSKDRAKAMALLNLILHFDEGEDDEAERDDLSETIRLMKFVRYCGAPAKDPYILQRYLKHEERLISRMRRGRIPVEGSCVYAVPDFTGKLKPGEVFYNGKTGPLGVFRSPCTHWTSPRRMLAVDIPELQHLRDVIVFSTVGSDANDHDIAAMDGGDFDGDRVTVIEDRRVWSYFHSRPPAFEWPAGSKPAQKNKILSKMDLAAYAIQQWTGTNIGKLDRRRVVKSDIWQNDGGKIQTPEGKTRFSKAIKDFPDLDALTFAEAASIDAASTGQLQGLKKEAQQPYPHWIPSITGVPLYHSKTTMGKLFDHVTLLVEKMHKMPADAMDSGKKFWIDRQVREDIAGRPYLKDPEDQAWVPEMARFYQSYNRAMGILAEDTADAKNRANQATGVLAGFRELRDKLSLGDPVLVQRQARAAMFAAYSGCWRSRQAIERGTWSLSFPWIVWGNDLIEMMADPKLPDYQELRIATPYQESDLVGDATIEWHEIRDAADQPMARIKAANQPTEIVHIETRLVAKVAQARFPSNTAPNAPITTSYPLLVVGFRRLGLDAAAVLEMARNATIRFAPFSEVRTGSSYAGAGVFKGANRMGSLVSDTPMPILSAVRGKEVRVTTAELRSPSSIRLWVELG